MKKTNNRLIRFTSLAIVLLSIVSCSSKKDQKEDVKAVADNFLTYYYTQGFKMAKELSDEETHKLLNKIKTLDKSKIEFYRQYLEEIEMVEMLSKDSAKVTYYYNNINSQRIKSDILVVKKQGNWLVNIANIDNIDFYNYIYDYSKIEVEGGVNLPLEVEEKVEIDIVVASFIEQINHSKLVIGLLKKDALNYYEIPNIDKFDESYNWFWSDLSTMGLYASIRFDYNDILEEVEYYISGIDSKNDLGVFKQMESLLRTEYGTPYNTAKETEGNIFYKSLRWFIKGANNELELVNNEDGTISLKVKGIN